MSSARILIVQTGEAIDAARARGPGFIGLFRSAVALAGVPTETRVVDVRGRAMADALPALSDAAGVIVTGSAGMVDENMPWMRFAVRLIHRALDEEVPFLGVCFGHQLLGHALGGDVGPNPRGRMMGTVEVTRTRDDVLFAKHPERFLAQVTHRDVIRDPGARLTVLASAPHDPVHAVRAGPVAWGVQFHPEFTVDTMRAYLEARRAVFDGEHGAGAADARLGGVVETPHARDTITSFVRLAHARREEARR